MKAIAISFLCHVFLAFLYGSTEGLQGSVHCWRLYPHQLPTLCYDFFVWKFLHVIGERQSDKLSYQSCLSCSVLFSSSQNIKLDGAIHLVWHCKGIQMRTALLCESTNKKKKFWIEARIRWVFDDNYGIIALKIIALAYEACLGLYCTPFLSFRHLSIHQSVINIYV